MGGNTYLSELKLLQHPSEVMQRLFVLLLCFPKVDRDKVGVDRNPDIYLNVSDLHLPNIIMIARG